MVSCACYYMARHACLHINISHHTYVALLVARIIVTCISNRSDRDRDVGRLDFGSLTLALCITNEGSLKQERCLYSGQTKVAPRDRHTPIKVWNLCDASITLNFTLDEHLHQSTSFKVYDMYDCCSTAIARNAFIKIRASDMVMDI